MFEKLKFKPIPRSTRKTTKKKIMLAIEGDTLKALNKFKPRNLTRQEAIRQIVEYYVVERELFG